IGGGDGGSIMSAGFTVGLTIQTYTGGPANYVSDAATVIVIGGAILIAVAYEGADETGSNNVSMTGIPTSLQWSHRMDGVIV
ncbi:MAG TPA: hypothetical protein VL727_09365, partial [Puia sp.]|nr:hypothetical protein [Puia sp.]